MEPRPRVAESRYSWVILVMVFINHMLIYGLTYSLGVFYQIFKEQFDATSAEISMSSSLLTGTLYGIGAFAGMLVNLLGYRVVAMIGGLIGSVGLILSCLATEIYHLYLSFGILAGIGFGIAYVPTISIIVEYFERRRVLAFGIGVSGVGVGTLMWPPLITYLEDVYGWRGAILLMAGITLHSIICGIFFHANSKIKNPEPKSKCAKIFNYHILTDYNYIIFCINQMLYGITVSAVYIHLPHYAAQSGLSKSHSRLLVSLMGVCNLIGRLAAGAISNLPKVDTILFYLISCLIMGALTMLCGYYKAYWSIMLYAALFGLFSATWGVLSPEITVQLLEPSLLPSAYGYILICDGIGSFAGAPIAGWVYDQTNYDTAFQVSGVFILVGGLIMLLPWKLPKRKAAVVLEDAINNTIWQEEVKNTKEETI